MNEREAELLAETSNVSDEKTQNRVQFFPRRYNTIQYNIRQESMMNLKVFLFKKNNNKNYIIPVKIKNFGSVSIWST